MSWVDRAARFFHGLILVAVIAVPAAGWFVDDWSAGTTLAVYWFENVAACLFVAVRIAAHQRMSPRHGHFRYQAAGRRYQAAGRRGARGAQSSSFIQGFLVTSIVFCAAHGIFLGFILFMLNRTGEGDLAYVDWRSVGLGCVIVFVFLVIDLGVDLVRLRSWSFLQIEQTANRGLSRVVVVHLTLIFGIFGLVITGAPSALFGVFVVLKTLYALTLVLPQWEPATPPGWLSRVMNRLPNVDPGETFEDHWVKDRAEEAKRRDRNEQPWAGSRQPHKGAERFGPTVQR